MTLNTTTGRALSLPSACWTSAKAISPGFMAEHLPPPCPVPSPLPFKQNPEPQIVAALAARLDPLAGVDPVARFAE